MVFFAVGNGSETKRLLLRVTTARKGRAEKNSEVSSRADFLTTNPSLLHAARNRVRNKATHTDQPFARASSWTQYSGN
jgi:hypothetical protein